MPTAKHRSIDEEDRWAMDLMREAQEEQRKNPMSPAQFAQECKRLMRYGARRAWEQGITEEDIGREIQAYRTERALRARLARTQEAKS